MQSYPRPGSRISFQPQCQGVLQESLYYKCAFLKAFSCLMIRLAYLGLFSVTHASIPEVSNKSIAALSASIRWHIGSVRSTSWSNMDCKSNKKSCLKRVNLEASGTTSNPQKSRNSWEYFRKTIKRVRILLV